MGRNNKSAATVIALVLPYLLLAIIGGITGSTDIGSPETTFIAVLWVLGLAFVWWPRRPQDGDGH